MHRPIKPKTILFYDHTAALSGGEIALLQLVQRLDHTRYRPIVLLSSFGALQDKLIEAGVETHVLPLAESVVHTRKDDLSRSTLLRLHDLTSVVAYTRKIARFARRRRVHLLHTNSLKADIIGAVAGRLARVPVVWHIRDRIADDYLPPKVARAFRLLCRILPNFIIANSAATMSTLHLTRPGSARSATPNRVIHDGVGIEGTAASLPPHPPSREDSKQPPRPVIGIVGRLSAWKGQHIFIQAARDVIDTFGDVKFQIIGSALFGEESYEVEIRSLISTLQLEHSVEMMGFVSNVPESIRNMDILVHASTTGEPFGQVVIEGMVEGKPIIATNGGGIPEIVEAGKTGLLIPMNDAAELSQAMIYLLKNPEQRQRMGQAGLQRVVEHFNIDQTARKVESVYDEILHKRRRR